MEERTREKAGKVIYDHLVKNWDETDGSTPREQAEERMKGYRRDLIKCVEDHKNIYTGDVWVDVQKKTEKIGMGKTHRLYFIGKQACPSPTNDQDVFRYNRKEDRIEYMWSVPDEAHCQKMMNDPLGIPPEAKELLGYVIDFKEGRLLKRAKELNGETKESPIIVKG